jgi:hypothetical protein
MQGADHHDPHGASQARETNQCGLSSDEQERSDCYPHLHKRRSAILAAARTGVIIGSSLLATQVVGSPDIWPWRRCIHACELETLSTDSLVGPFA